MKAIRKKGLSSLSLRSMIVILVLLTVFFSLFASAVLVQNYVVERENAVIQEKISSVARIVAKDLRVQEGIIANDFDGGIQEYAQSIIAETGVDFVVVMNNNLIRFSHPEESVIGETFSNVEDARQALAGEEHYSEQIGVLGSGTRFFTPVFDSEGNQIGVICVGYTSQTIDEQINRVQSNLFLGLGLGLLVGLAGALLLARKVKKTLFGLEPAQIAENMRERTIIGNAVTEGIIAVSKEGKVLLSNENAKAILEKANLKRTITVGEELASDVYNIFFQESILTEKRVSNRSVVLNQLELVLSVSPIVVDDAFYGAVATFRDQSEMQHLIRELSGTEQYIDSLRAQSHKFMNQLHVILGLVELGKYSEVADFIEILNTDYHEQIGYVTEKIKSPAIAGFLLGKANEAKEQEVSLMIDPDSRFPNTDENDLVHSLLLAIGVLVDNACEAVRFAERKEVSLYLFYDKEERIIIFEVEDTGEGMDESLKDKIFRRGFSTKGEKRGYGLDAVQTIVNQYDGMIDVYSQTGKGSKFSVEIPYHLEEQYD